MRSVPLVLALAPALLAGLPTPVRAAPASLPDDLVHELRFPQLADKCADVAGADLGDGANVRLWSCDNSGAQRFRVMTFDDTRFQLVSTISGRCAEAEGGGAEDGTNVRMWACNDTDARKWRAERLPDGAYDLPNKKSGRCRDVDRGGTADGADSQPWSCNQTAAQRINPVPAHTDTMMEHFDDTAATTALSTSD